MHRPSSAGAQLGVVRMPSFEKVSTSLGQTHLMLGPLAQAELQSPLCPQVGAFVRGSTCSITGLRNLLVLKIYLNPSAALEFRPALALQGLWVNAGLNKGS